jgi:ElaB/YqjD/DUF883 family membrane-anchored ribosome-binding protein
MSQNVNNTTKPSTGGAGTGATDAGTTRDKDTSTGTSFGSSSGTGSTGTSGGGAGSLSTTGSATGTGGGAGTGTAPARDGIAGMAQEYGQKITDAASQAKDYVSDKLTPAVDKFKELQNKDYGQMADDAKEYAKQNPGQAILISAAAGFLLGLLLRNSRR